MLDCWRRGQACVLHQGLVWIIMVLNWCKVKLAMDHMLTDSPYIEKVLLVQLDGVNTDMTSTAEDTKLLKETVAKLLLHMLGPNKQQTCPKAQICQKLSN